MSEEMFVLFNTLPHTVFCKNQHVYKAQSRIYQRFTFFPSRFVCTCVWYFVLEGEQKLAKPSDDSVFCSGACNKNRDCSEPAEKSVSTWLCVKG